MKKEALLTTCFGLGKLPIAPGTFGSLVPVVLYQVLGYLYPWANIYVMAFLIAAGSWVCIQYGPLMITATGKKDPQEVVADEVAGQALVMLVIALLKPANICNAAVIGFVLFRLFDIVKPWPCKKLEKLHDGFGILADDLMAGIYGAIVAALFILAKIHLRTESTPGPMELNLFFSMILGLVQGLTEFLPVSSSGHLVLLEHFLPSLDVESKATLLFDLSLHVATIGSILFVFYADIAAFFKRLFKIKADDIRNPMRLYRRNPAVRFCVLGIVSVATTGICYAMFKEPLESARSLPILAVSWIITAVLLLAADHRKRPRRGLREVGIGFAVLIGIAQSVSILPAVSRSGATICTAILLGLHRQWAIEFSFLIAFPAILGGALLHVLENPDLLTSGELPKVTLLLGMGAAFAAGVLSLKWLVRASRRQKLRPFALYCLVLAGFVLFYLL